MTQETSNKSGNSILEYELPEGYGLTYNDVQPAEIMALRPTVGWDADTIERWQSCIESSLAVIGVRTSNNELVGMGVVAGNLRHAVLCDLVVKPAHQHKGIGTAIFAEQVHTIEQNNISYVYTSLAATNTLRDRFTELGFVSDGISYFWARR